MIVGMDKPDSPAPTVSIKTHGCKLNQADSEALADQFTQAGYRVAGPNEAADVQVVNTCTVTHIADRKARQAVRASYRESPSSLLVATGCYAQRAPGDLSSLQGVGIVAGNSDKHRLVDMVAAALGNQTAPNTAGVGPSSEQESDTTRRTRAMVKIQEGCNQICSYCIVPKVRGRERSIPPETILDEVRRRVRQGYKETVLTGTQLGSYGFEFSGVDLVTLLETLLDRSGIGRLRVSSLQPQEITDELLDLWKDPRLCPHFHLPLQSGSDRVLEKMRRRYTAGEHIEAVKRIRSRVAGSAITADIIVGFPGEEEEDFQATLEVAKTVEFASIHVFPYSARPGTGATHMGAHVDSWTKKVRMEELLALARQQASGFRRGAIGSVRQVLWERMRTSSRSYSYWGLTDNYLKVYTSDDRPLLNEITSARLTEESGEVLLASAL